MARLYHTFGDIEGKLDVLRVECTNCERKNVRFGSGPTKLTVATRYDKLAANYLAFIQLASIRLWLRINEPTT